MAVLPEPDLPEQRGPRRGHPHQHRDRGQQRRRDHQAYAGQHEVERALAPRVPPGRRPAGEGPRGGQRCPARLAAGHRDPAPAARRPPGPGPAKRYRLTDVVTASTRVSIAARSRTSPRTVAGLPNATRPSGMSRTTTAPAPIRQPAPMRTNGRTVTFTPICAPAPIDGPASSVAESGCPG